MCGRRKLKARKVMADVLSTPVILAEIFKNFSSTKLLQLSLVNKHWKREARSVMRNRGDFTVHIGRNRTCQELGNFAYDLERMNVLPFSGMTLTLQGLQHKDWCRKSSTGELDVDCENILDQMTWKNLAVSFNYGWDQSQDCTAYLLVEKVFKKYCRTIERLSIQVDYKRGDLLESVLSGCSFPNLKTFRLRKPRDSVLIPGATREGDAKLIKTLISAAPNLQVLYTEECVDLKANLLEGSLAVHVTDYEYYFSSLHGIPESGVVDLRMRRMRLDTICPQLNAERFNRMASTLLQSSRTTLSSMEIAAIFLMPLASYRACLQNVRTLRLRFSDAILEREPRLWRLLKSFDFKRIFPNLSAVQILWMFNSDFEPILNAFNDMIEEENTTFSDPMHDRAANITSLSLQWPSDILDYSTEFLTQMFPDIEKLTIRAEDTIPFTRIWDSWQDLKELDITLWGFRNTEKFDSTVCGIFPEEVAQLREQDEEYLRRVNIVPVMPAITCLKGLRTFSLYFKELSYYGRLDDPTYGFSTVTDLLAFQRCADLTVTLKTTYQRRE